MQYFNAVDLCVFVCLLAVCVCVCACVCARMLLLFCHACMWCGQKEPWEGRDAIEVVLTVCAGERMVIPPSVPPSIARLMQSCWEHDPTARPSFEQILRTLAALQPV